MTKTLLLIATTASLAISQPDWTAIPSDSMDGVVQTRWPDGTLRSEIGYRGGEHEGAYRTWYRSGRPYELRHYRRGHEEGLQQAWTESGELYINYEARDGRHYGLINSTPCVPVEPATPALPYYEGADFSPRWKEVDHRIGAFRLTTQTGAEISEADLDGRIHIASFIYTRCAAVCPILVRQLARVQTALEPLANVTLVSYSVTPEEDTPNALAAFGRDRRIDPDRWWLVTGQRDQIFGLARNSYFADDDRVDGVDGSFLHTEKVLLVDAERRLRGVYNGTQPHDVDQLIADVKTLWASRLSAGTR